MRGRPDLGLLDGFSCAIPMWIIRIMQPHGFLMRKRGEARRPMINRKERERWEMVKHHGQESERASPPSCGAASMHAKEVCKKCIPRTRCRWSQKSWLPCA